MDYLSAIRAYPDIDEPRLHYAQYLRSKGDPRGEFIEVQCKLARCTRATPHQTKVDLQKKEAELYNTFGDSWLDELGLQQTEATFIRGFVEKVTLTPERVLELHATLTQNAFIRTLRLCNPDRDEFDAYLFDDNVNTYWTRLWEPDQPSQPKRIVPLHELLSLPLLNEVESLVLSELVDFRYGLQDPPRVGTAIAQAKNLKNLRKLNLAGVYLSPEDTYELCTAQHLRTLQVLDVRESFLEVESIETFVGHANFQALHTLMLGENLVNPNAIASLMQSKTFSELVHLDLSSNIDTLHNDQECGCRSMMLAMANAGCVLSKVRALKLSARCIDSAVATALSKMKLMQHLTRLLLDNCELSDQALSLLFGERNFASLQELSLARNQLSAISGGTLAQQTQWTKLKTLDVSGNMLEDQGVIALAKAPYFQTIEHLDLAANNVTDQGVFGMIAAPPPIRLQSLCLSVNQLSADGVKVLLTQFNSPMLHTLELSVNQVETSEPKLFTQKPCKLPSLYRIDLAFNNIAGSIEFPETVREIDLVHNQLPASAINQQTEQNTKQSQQFIYCQEETDAVIPAQSIVELQLEDGRTAYADSTQGWSVLESMVFVATLNPPLMDEF